MTRIERIYADNNYKNPFFIRLIRVIRVLRNMFSRASTKYFAKKIIYFQFFITFAIFLANINLKLELPDEQKKLADKSYF